MQHPKRLLFIKMFILFVYLFVYMFFIAKMRNNLFVTQDLMKVRLEELKKEIEWVERLDITTDTKNLPGLPNEETAETTQVKDNVEDDFQRELQL